MHCAAQAHILTNITFRHCGVSAEGGAEGSPNIPRGRGCGDGNSGCLPSSSVWSLLCFSDLHVPEFMQATAGVRYEDCGRIFRCLNGFKARGTWESLGTGMNSSQSERAASWLDTDGSATGSGVPTIIGSAAADAGDWWKLDEDCQHSSEGPLWFCAQRGARQIGSLHFHWDEAEHAKLGVTKCGNGKSANRGGSAPGMPCTPLGCVPPSHLCPTPDRKRLPPLLGRSSSRTQPHPRPVLR